MTPTEFISKWRQVSLTERASAQQHFLDLCALVNHPTPAAADPTGDHFTFERGASKHDGGEGWADVWKRGFFAFEYKGKHKNLTAAYDQLLNYRESLENPPLLAVCDLDRILIHTNFTATTKALHSIALEDLGEPRNLEILRHLFHEPDRLKPGTTSETITQDAAGRLARLAESLRQRDVPPADAAHFLVRIVFCLFAEDIGLLPNRIFTSVVEKTLTQLFHRESIDTLKAMTDSCVLFVK